MNLKLVMCEVVQWIHLTPNRDQWLALVNAMVRNVLVPEKSKHFSSNQAGISLSKRNSTP
jgi:hypothetical protein